jgi:hypothetical protein
VCECSEYIPKTVLKRIVVLKADKKQAGYYKKEQPEDDIEKY